MKKMNIKINLMYKMLCLKNILSTMLRLWIKYNINTNKIKNIDNEHPVLCNK